MKGLLAVLGLPDTATEAEAIGKIDALRDAGRALCALTGKDSHAAALAEVHAWKAAAGKAADLRAALAQREDAERAAYIADVMAARHLGEEMRPMLERDARANWEQFQEDIPRPSREELAARAQDGARTARLPAGPAKGRAPIALVGAEPSAELLRNMGLTAEQYRETQERMRKEGVL